MGRSGRPRLKTEANLKSVYITKEQVEYARNVGEGNVSLGIRTIIDEHVELKSDALVKEIDDDQDARESTT